ncbi:hypothetical protein TanjilG_12602 [Lupinus angustifolius]|uniref:Uncharacterized protein n=1 Tax=Lupinus angustifolius TaxID=3871 RepID=A0A4P1QYQ3_LUPAN|nr:PREDICTED: protein ECERIFERUM 1-like [Lupinus angustifolius]OIV97845.1 hypothetical protein TanjilG_12602 [Lupinus angustifolius]
MAPIPNSETPFQNSIISTVVPATPREDQNGAFHLTSMDLLMKLHYIRPVYFFTAEAVQGLSISDLKKPMFTLLDMYSHVSGRIRRSESGFPFIKCNDAGVRIAESRCEITLREWFHENGVYSVHGLVHDHVLGPHLSFSPLVFVKFTWFKCGGLCVGLSWAHILGDAFSAFNFITKWSQILVGHTPPKSLHTPNIKEPKFPPSYNIYENPISIKKATVVGEYWLGANNIDVATHSFHFTFKQLQHLVTSTSNQSQITITSKNTSYFEIISAMLMKSIAHIKGEFGTKVLTICTNNNSNHDENEFPNNGLVLSRIEADLEADISELAKLISEKKMVENHIMEKLIEKDEGKEDYIVYGANLTFVDLEEAEIYEVKLNGHKPIMANCTIHGVGDEGVVLVLPAPEDIDDGDGGGGNGRIVTVSLPEKELNQLKDKIGKEWSIV